MLRNKIFAGVKNLKLNNKIPYKQTGTSNIDYVVIEKFPEGYNYGDELNCCVRIMFNYGRLMNIELIYEFMQLWLEIFTRVFELHKIHFVMILWDYPTYGRATLPDSFTEPGLFFSLAKEVYEVLQIYPSPCVDSLSIVIGQSLGTSVASYLSTINTAPELVVLMNPFSKLLEGTGSFARLLLDEPFDNVKMLKKKNVDCKILAAFAQCDETLPVSLNLPGLNSVLDEWYEEPGAKHNDLFYNIGPFTEMVRRIYIMVLEKLKIKVEVQNMIKHLESEHEEDSIDPPLD